MQNTDIIKAIDTAKDDVGVITPRGLHVDLASLTPADWKQASMIYNKSSAKNNNGLYIEDDANGKVTIHNDMTKAHDTADKSVPRLVLDDAKAVAITALGATGLAGSLGSFMAYEVATDDVTGMASASASGLSAAWTGLGVGLLTGAEIAGAIGAGVLVFDTAIDFVDHKTAQKDVRENSVLSFDSKKPV